MYLEGEAATMDKKRKADGKELISEHCDKDEEASTCTVRDCGYTLTIIIALTTYVSLHQRRK